MRAVRGSGVELTFDTPVEAVSLEGRELFVTGAEPTEDQDGWLVHVLDGESFEDFAFPEIALESTGLIERTDESGKAEIVPLDRSEVPGWQDDVMLELETETLDEAEAERIAAAAAAAVGEFLAAEDTASRVERIYEDPYRIVVWVYAAGDALDAFESIVSRRPSEWQWDEDQSVFICARWQRPAVEPRAEFLVPEVRAATVLYRRWTSPERRTLPPPSR